ncbi:MAG TPA: transcriptional repressor [Acidobacteriaceae bacterium]|jgi:Fur family ferric uptake transcriptional regulator|nr:transcriptional repressor [Acidobacteriaceae bacterium]
MEQRNTKQKRAIREAFLENDRPLSPDEAMKAARRLHRKLSIATVYRNIQSLVEEMWLEPVEIPGDATRYEVSGKKHHDHFHCNSCGKVFDLDGCGAKGKPKLPKGFRATGHEFFLYGSCAECSPARS